MALRTPAARRPALSLQLLEARDVPAVVTATVAGGVLTLTGTDAADTLTLQDTGANMLVTGSAGTQVLFGGTTAATQNVPGVNGVKFVLKGGADDVRFSPTSPLDLAGSVAADMGDGNNVFNVDFAGAANGRITGGLTYTGRGGNDTLTLGPGGNTLLMGKLTVNAGDGANAVTLSDVNVAGAFTHTGGGGTDAVVLNNSDVLGAMTVSNGLGSASTTVDLNGSGVVGNLAIKGGGGVNTLKFAGANTVDGAAGVSMTSASASLLLTNTSGTLTVTNGGLTMAGKNADTRVGSAIGMPTLPGAVTVKKGVTLSNQFVSAHFKDIKAGALSATGALNTAFRTTGDLEVTGAFKATAAAGPATAEFLGTDADVGGATTVTAQTYALVNSSGLGAEFVGPVTVTSTRGTGEFFHENAPLTVRGALTVKGPQVSYLTVRGTGVKLLEKDVSVSSALSKADLEIAGAETDIAGTVSVKGYSVLAAVSTTSPNSHLGTHLNVAAGGGGAVFGWGGGFHISGDTTITSLGAANITFGSAAANTTVRTVKVTTAGGADSVTFNNVSSVGSTTVKTGGGNDTVAIDKTVFSGLFTLDTGDGDDTLNIAQVTTNNAATTFTRGLAAKLGAGNDTLRLGTLNPADPDKAAFGVASLIDGGLGLNAYVSATSQDRNTTNLTLLNLP